MRVYGQRIRLRARNRGLKVDRWFMIQGAQMELGVSLFALIHVRCGLPFSDSPARPTGLLGYDLMNQSINQSTQSSNFATMLTSTQKPIIISGAGLASLLLAQSLLRASIPFLIFEQDSSISFRAQGYRLRLSSEGLDAIESVLGSEGFQKFWDKCGKTGGGGFEAIDAITGSKISAPATDGDGDKAADKRPEVSSESLVSRGGKIVGISRGDMRRSFMSGCEPFVRWSHRVTSYELTSSGVRAVFADGSKSVEGEMLVAADGIHSKIARQLSQGKLKVYDTGARGIHG